ncbi:MAG: TonB-dependent receptor [Terracidiphilus sp.]|jgi:hypothetical protein
MISRIFKHFQVCIFLLLLGALPALLSAQVDRGTINGTVKDQSGAVIPGVTISVTNVDTGVTSTTLSNANGFYEVLNEPVGRYSLRFSKAGFRELLRKGVTLTVAQVAEINETLQVGAATEVVQVTDDAPVIETETSDVASDIKATTLTDLPLNVSGGRDVESFAFAVMPGVEGNPYTANINGTQNFTKEVKIDGLSLTSTIQGDQMETGPTMEAVGELNAQTSGLSADNSSTPGGVELFTIKSGTNVFHGSAFGYGHNELLDANSWYNPDKSPKPKERFWDWGFSGGGPVRIPKLYDGRNKTFVFGAFEKYQQADFTSGGLGPTVPTSAFLGGDFSALITAGGNSVLGTDGAGNTIYKGSIFDPTTGNVFVGNKIPSARFSKVAQQIIAIYQKDYVPANTSLTGNELTVASNSPSQNTYEYTMRVDHNISAKNHIFGDYIYHYTPRLLVDGASPWQPGSTDGGPLANNRIQLVRAFSYHVSDSHTVTASLLNVASVAYQRYWNGSVPQTSTDYPPQFGFGETGASNFPVVRFNGSVNGVGESHIGNQWSGHYIGATYIYSDTLSWVHGRHTLKMGGEFWHQTLGDEPTNGALTFAFDPSQTGAPKASYASNVGFSFASFELGDVQLASEAVGVFTHSRRDELGVYFQDDYRVNPKLTLNLGLRWDVTTPLTERQGRWTVFNTNAMDTVWNVKGVDQYAMNGSTSFEGSPDLRQFGPHVGFAYQVTHRLVARGSYGITYTPIGTNTWGAVPYDTVAGFQGSNTVPLNSNFTPAFNWDSGYPGKLVPGVLNPHVTEQSSVNGYWESAIDPHSLSQGYIHQFNAGAEYALAKDTRLTVNYVGNRGRRLHDGNLATTEPSAAAELALWNSYNEWDWVDDAPSAAAAGVTLPYNAFSGYALQAINQFPQIASQYTTLYFVGTHLGQTNYDAMQVEAMRRTGQGFTFDMSYTLGRAIGDTGNNFAEEWTTGAFQDFSKLNQEATLPQTSDTRNVLKGYVTYSLPFGHGRKYLAGNNLADKFVGGWDATTLLHYNSGQPLPVFATNDYYGWAAVYPNVNLKGNFGRKFHFGNFVQPTSANPAPAGDQYFDATNFTQPAYGSLGTGPEIVSALRGFGYAGEDAALLKYTSFGPESRFKLSIRVEFYNLLNRHYFSNPNTNIASDQFGYVTSNTGTPRNGQFGARFQW